MLASGLVTFASQSMAAPGQSDCVECSALYKFCPAHIGCGYADPSGVTCYCNDWTWCSDHPDCSETQVLRAVSNLTNEFDLITLPCNGSDPRQWILRVDPSCTFIQEVAFYPRDAQNNIFVLTENLGQAPQPNIYATYVSAALDIPLNPSFILQYSFPSIQTIYLTHMLVVFLTVVRIFNTTWHSQKWTFNNRTLSPQTAPTMCLDVNAVTFLPELRSCSTYPSWVSIDSPLSYLIFQHVFTSRCLAIDVTPET